MESVVSVKGGKYGGQDAALRETGVYDRAVEDMHSQLFVLLPVR